MTQNIHSYPIGLTITPDSMAFQEIQRTVLENAPKIAELSGAYRSRQEIRAQLADITQSPIDDSVTVNLPVYSDFGRHLRIGKNVFINSGVLFTDLGGIVIEDDVLIGSQVKLISVGHPLNPAERHGLILNPVRICRNAWIGASATILPGVTIGENAVVAAGAVVSKDVPPNTVVAGIPAKIMKTF
ncbi:DapH/DapD/GlmU-related protein [Neisseria perflava]|uniref:DapH/DapD/GlmU-related protein n=1 Tax=Neisseria perflava TaxID=33053 RepID=UPI0026462FF1|nr:DapH/DapD/GlmU-related protein [Neisseria perflava]MCP1660064.1 acetyltransferase-like isoleucine patch superfamily enzyme [Neisseria perflava]MCP1773026.1 acetyltransferase-like isoleucine patch superfamily enzyme [Neisseria perflava]